MSPTQFSGLSCVQLSGELERLSRREIDLYNQLKDLADNDEAQMGVGLLLLWPTLFFLEGGDGTQAAEYSRVRGEQDAIEKIMMRKECDANLLAPKLDRDAQRSVPERLKALDELRDNGTITEEEYVKQRKKILDAL